MIKDWFLDYFNQDYSELILDSITPEFTGEQVKLLKELLKLEPADRILDACCGKGRHAISLAREGYSLTALDFVPSYIDSIQEIARTENLSIQMVTLDIREIEYSQFFDKIYLMFTSFGYFADPENELLLQKLQKSLKKGGLLLVDIENRDYILKNFIYEKWREKEFGLLLERHRFFPETSRQTTRRIQYYKDGTQKESFRDLRLYSLHEMILLAQKVGLKLVKTIGDYDGKPFQINSPRIIAVYQA